MKVGINAISIKCGNIGGMESYVRELIHYLSQIDQENEYILVLGPDNHKSFQLSSYKWKKIVFLGPDSSPLVFKYAMHDIASAGNRLCRFVKKGYDYFRTAGCQFYRGRIAELIYEENIDIWFCPLIYSIPYCKDIPVVNTIPDLQHEYFPEFFGETELSLRTLGYQFSCMSATATIGISRYTADDIVDTYGIDPKKVFAIPLGLARSFEISAHKVERLAVRVRTKYRIKRGYVYFPAKGWIHKNHIKLVEAMYHVNQRGINLDLILSGMQSDLLDRLNPVIKRYNLQNRILHLGHVSNEDVIGLYAGAKMLAFPSLFEGFGLPLLEAMYIGTPIVCSQIGSLPEIAGKAAMYFDPQNAESIAHAITAVVNDIALQERLVTAGKQRLKRYTYLRTAVKTLEIFKAIEKGELRIPRLQFCRGLASDNSLSTSYGRWYFHSSALKKLRVCLRYDMPTTSLPNPIVQILLNGTKVLESAMMSGKNPSFSILPSKRPDNGFYQLDILVILESNSLILSNAIKIVKIDIFNENCRPIRLI